jgi:hypothetical protein
MGKRQVSKEAVSKLNINDKVKVYEESFWLLLPRLFILPNQYLFQFCHSVFKLIILTFHLLFFVTIYVQPVSRSNKGFVCCSGKHIFENLLVNFIMINQCLNFNYLTSNFITNAGVSILLSSLYRGTPPSWISTNLDKFEFTRCDKGKNYKLFRGCHILSDVSLCNS